MSDKKAFSVNEFLDAFKIGRTRAYEEIASGRLVTYRVGRRRYISARAAEEWQRKLEQMQLDSEEGKTFNSSSSEE
jgi:hypothetical protein